MKSLVQTVLNLFYTNPLVNSVESHNNGSKNLTITETVFQSHVGILLLFLYWQQQKFAYNGKKIVGPLKSLIAGCSCNLNHELEGIIAFSFSFLMTYTGAIMIEKIGIFHLEKIFSNINQNTSAVQQVINKKYLVKRVFMIAIKNVLKARIFDNGFN